MLPKIIHNIWIQGYENLPNEIKVNHLKLKKRNQDWEFIIWDDEMIKKLLKKYPRLYEMYNNNSYTVFDKDSIKSHIARYIILKEYGGLYFDIEYKCTSTFENLFFTDDSNDNKSKNTIYIATSKINYWNYIYSLQKTKYSSSFMAMDKNHPIWDKVIEKLKQATTKYQINNALDNSLMQIENNHKTRESAFPIVLLSKVNGNYNQCENKDTACYKPNSSVNFINSLYKYLNCYYKQILLFILAVVIIICVEYLYMHNAKVFGPVNFIPGMPGSAPPSHPILQKKKSKSKGK
jgi:hypothetical protein